MNPRHQSIIVLTLAAIVVLAALSAAATAITAKVVSVSDGDTIKARIDGEQVDIRLWGIDAPEKGQAGGDLATATMQRLVAGHDITVQDMGRDRYGRTLAMVYAEGGGEKSVNEDMIRAGAAWVYTKYCTAAICAQWDRYQQAAQAAGTGLWRDAAPVPPWEWRHGGKQMALAAVAADMGTYIGNTNTRKFHTSGCRHAGCKHCTAVFSSRSAAIAAGFVPCKVCRP